MCMNKNTPRTPHWSVERNLANDGWVRIIATDAGTCAVACDRYGDALQRTCEICDQPILASEKFSGSEKSGYEHRTCTADWFRRNFGAEALQ